MKILTAVTNVPAHVEQSSVLDFGDPELFKFPVIYLIEPGFWGPSEEQFKALKDYLRKGGFMIVDDFPYWAWDNFAYQMSRVFPEGQWKDLDVTHPIFNSFFHIQTLDGMTHPDNASAKAEYLGIFEDNDPTKRLMVIVNYNNDIGDYMEWSGGGYYPVKMSNDAYKFATNYVIYALTH